MPKKTRRLSFKKKGPTNEENFLVVEELRQKYKLSVLLSIANLKKQTYFYIRNKDGLDCKNIEIINIIEEIFYKNHKNYGYRRITFELRNQGYLVNHKKVQRLMKKLNLVANVGHGKYRSYKGKIGVVAKNIINRDFEANCPNEKWTTDVTEFQCIWGKAYLSPILDMFSGDIVSYNISRHPNYDQIESMLGRAFEKYPNVEGLIFHSDQGWQYQYYKYRHALKEHGIIQSMSRKGNCLDNAIMENFFGILKREMFYGHELEFKSYTQLKNAIDDYIDYYNNERIKIRLGGIPPLVYRAKFEGIV